MTTISVNALFLVPLTFGHFIYLHRLGLVSYSSHANSLSILGENPFENAIV